MRKNTARGFWTGDGGERNQEPRSQPNGWVIEGRLWGKGSKSGIEDVKGRGWVEYELCLGARHLS